MDEISTGPESDPTGDRDGDGAKEKRLRLDRTNEVDAQKASEADLIAGVAGAEAKPFTPGSDPLPDGSEPQSSAGEATPTNAKKRPGLVSELSGTMPPFASSLSMTARWRAMFCSADPSAPAWTPNSSASSLRAERLESRSSSLRRSTMDVW